MSGPGGRADATRRFDASPALLAFVVLLAGCGAEGDVAAGTSPGAGAPASDSGPVQEPAHTGPERIVSLLPAATEILVELEAGDRIVARAEGDPALATRNDLPSVGDALDPSLEVLGAARPELIVAWTGSDAAALERTLAPGGRLLTLDLQGFGDLAAAVDTLGAILGSPGRARGLTGEIAEQLREAARIAASSSRSPASEGSESIARDPPSIAWIVWPDPLTLAGPGSFPDRVLRLAGGVNIVREDEGPWPVVGLETLVDREPRILVWPRGGGIPGPESVPANWSRITAFEEGRVLRVPADTVHVPGPGLTRMMPEIARRIAELDRGWGP